MSQYKSIIRRKQRRKNRSKKTSRYHDNRNRLVLHHIINDFEGHTILSVSSKDKDLKPVLKNVKSKLDMSKKIGTALAVKAKKQNIEMVVFDRNGYPYHGRVKVFVEAARENGLNL
jgi:large subunit ribosomal protein L18